MFESGWVWFGFIVVVVVVVVMCCDVVLLLLRLCVLCCGFVMFWSVTLCSVLLLACVFVCVFVCWGVGCCVVLISVCFVLI